MDKYWKFHEKSELLYKLQTHFRAIVHQNDLLHQTRRRLTQHRVDGPQQYRPRLVVETDDDAGLWQQGDVAIAGGFASRWNGCLMKIC